VHQVCRRVRERAASDRWGVPAADRRCSLNDSGSVSLATMAPLLALVTYMFVSVSLACYVRMFDKASAHRWQLSSS
jgi:hypothetical protein